jgi:alpha-D-ribose 1-methylphosphonate 5-triphosphate synthase subunit PhnG
MNGSMSNGVPHASPSANGVNSPDQSHYLSVLAQAGAEEISLFAEGLLPHLAPVEVIQNRTGLAMLPTTDSVQGGVFHLGEVLVAEAHVRVGQQEGYAACLGRNLVQALALAILDAVLQDVDAHQAVKPQVIAFVDELAARQAVAERELLQKIETTRVELEVF